MSGLVFDSIDHMRRGMKLLWTMPDGAVRTGSVVTQADLRRMKARLGVIVDGGLPPVSALSLIEDGLQPTLVSAAEPPSVLNAKASGKNVPGAIYVGRPSKWGNPFEIGRHGDRDEVIEKYLIRLHENPDFVLEVRRLLAGSNLICWCHPEPCHAHILRDLAMGAPLPPLDQKRQDDLFPQCGHS